MRCGRKKPKAKRERDRSARITVAAGKPSLLVSKGILTFSSPARRALSNSHKFPSCHLHGPYWSSHLFAHERAASFPLFSCRHRLSTVRSSSTATTIGSSSSEVPRWHGTCRPAKRWLRRETGAWNSLEVGTAGMQRGSEETVVVEDARALLRRKPHFIGERLSHPLAIILYAATQVWD